MKCILNPPTESSNLKNVTITQPAAYKNKKGNVRFLLQGNEGVGKTYTLGLLTYVLKNSTVKQKIRVFYIQNCILFSAECLSAIKEEFHKAFPEKNCADIQDISALQNLMFKVLEDYKKEGTITVFIADQLNKVGSNFIMHFLHLTELPWKIQIYSQSATNITNENFKILFQTTINYSCDNFFTDNSVKSLIRNLIKEESLSLNLTNEDFNKISVWLETIQGKLVNF